jgi:mannitol-1-phosphate 5-dehydrogenase
MLQIFAEPYNTLILNKKGFRNEVPDIKGLAPKDNMKAWVDRKLFIHNLGHSAAAYIGNCFDPGFIHMYEVLAVPEIIHFVRCTMQQSAAILLREYPEEFTLKDLDDHIEDLLHRFRNRALGDTVFRVGCDLMRKLGPEDRLAGAIKKAFEMSLPYENILFSLVCGSLFRATDEDGHMYENDISFAGIRNRGIQSVLSEVCCFDVVRHKEIYDKALLFDNCLKSSSNDFLSSFQNRMKG